MTLKKIFHLGFIMAKVDSNQKNEGSYLGILWYLLNPILLSSLLFLIFFDRLGTNIPLYPIYLFTGVIMFNFFQQTTLESVKTISNNKFLIKSLNFPKESLVLSIILKNSFSHFFEIIILLFLLIYFQIPSYMILFYAPIFILLAIFTYGVSLFLSSLTVFIIDIDNIWNFASRLIWIGTPIFYRVDGQLRLLKLNLFNPLYYFLTLARQIFLIEPVKNLILIGALVSSILSLLIGQLTFNLLKNKFAERI